MSEKVLGSLKASWAVNVCGNDIYAAYSSKHNICNEQMPFRHNVQQQTEFKIW